jgi:hypothetical protein
LVYGFATSNPIVANTLDALLGNDAAEGIIILTEKGKERHAAIDSAS